MVLKTGCVIDEKIRKVIQTVIAMEKKNVYFIMKTLLTEKKNALT